MHVAKDARQRVHEVPAKDAGTELAGSICGRLLLKGSISREHYDAAMSFQATHAAYMRSIEAPSPDPRAVDIGGVTAGPSSREITPEWAALAFGRWKAACSALSRANEEHRSSALYAACLYVVLRGEYLPHMFGDLRLGLNALARHYGLLARAA